MIEIDVHLFPRHSIRKLLVPINQSTYLICVCFVIFLVLLSKKSQKSNPSEKHDSIDYIDMELIVLI